MVVFFWVIREKSRYLSLKAEISHTSIYTLTNPYSHYRRVQASIHTTFVDTDRSTHAHYKTRWQLWKVAAAKRSISLFGVFKHTRHCEKVIETKQHV